MTSESQDHQGTTERSTSGTVRRRRTVRRGPAIGGDDAGDEFVPVTDTITPDEVTSTPPVEATPASMPVSDSATLALVLDAVRSFLEGHDGLGGDHPVTQDRLERLRRVAVLVERD